MNIYQIYIYTHFFYRIVFTLHIYIVNKKHDSLTSRDILPRSTFLKDLPSFSTTLQHWGEFHILVLQRTNLDKRILDPAMAAGWSCLFGKKPTTVG